MRPFPMKLKLFKWVFNIIFNVSRIGFVFFIGISLILAFLPNISLLLTEKIGDALTEYRNNPSLLIWLLISQAIIYILFQLVTLSGKIFEVKLNSKYMFRFEYLIRSKLSRVKQISLESTDVQNKISMLSSITPHLGIHLLNNALSLMKSCIALTLMVYILHNIHWVIIVLLIILSVLNIYVTRLYNQYQMDILTQNSEKEREKEFISSIFTDYIKAAEIRIFQRYAYLLRKWENSFWHVQHPLIKIGLKRDTLFTGLQIVTQILNASMLIVLVLSSTTEISIGSFMLVTQAILMFQNYANDIVNSLSYFNQASIYLPSLFDVMNMEEEENDPNGKSFKGLQSSLSVHQLSFHYGDSDKVVLNNISFRINKGEKVAILGDNGSGKSTLLKCMIGLYDHYEGTICYDDIDIRNYEKSSFRNNISVLFQRFGKYPMSLFENITLGDELVDKNDPDLKQTVANSGLSDIVSQLPRGANTMLSPVYQDGVDLSGGQWQRVALARTYARRPSVLFLDEPTSAIDPLSERQINEDFMEFADEKTAIIVTHRLNICKYVDKIIVMQQGSIVEIGSHEELININGIYKEMVLSQDTNLRLGIS
ncbi:hypothetical protein AZ66_21175 [Paenibacillus sp. E194]|uniref:ABC transporter n=1 Tax=Paenibacillus alvei TS-15 TaxID=1117108 RepID=S9SVG1_PAEAL|nr:MULTISPECIES: ATP-binding cassette domain-containing protein [Paenibacillus]EPY08639.1 ABC transporter [Paenibacillus alvei TS-15]KJB86036.1 hypothetical protein AZ66_21175 [Paenibacillus sp. E194]